MRYEPERTRPACIKRSENVSGPTVRVAPPPARMIRAFLSFFRIIFRTAFIAALGLAILISPLSAQRPFTADDLRKKSNEVVTFYKAGKLKEAQKAAEQSIDIASAVFGEGHKETALSLMNAGEIARARKKFRESAEFHRKALGIFRRDIAQHASEIATVSEKLGMVLAMDKQEKEAEEMFAESRRVADMAFPPDSPERLPIIRSHALFRVFVKDFEGADEIFSQLYFAAGRVFGRNAPELEKIEDEHICLVAPRLDSFKEHGFTSRLQRVKQGVYSGGGIPAGSKIVYGKAVRMTPVDFPVRIRDIGASGPVVVKVAIDPDGTVSRAKAICGPQVLFSAIENAALLSRFSPTTIDGVPISITGVLWYSFD